MDTDEAPHIASYEMPLPEEGGPAPALVKARESASLPESLLLRNVMWFGYLRWTVAVVLLSFGVAGYFPKAFEAFGLRPHEHWPFITAAVLAIANLVFISHARLLARSPSSLGVRANLWVQIVLDLLVLTVVVHHLGSLETYAPFTYLFHIVLACIFFSRAQSLAVTAMASVMFVGCVILEMGEVLPQSGIYAGDSLRQAITDTKGAVVLNVFGAIATWMVVWYLASSLSGLVRQRDHELAQINERLLQAQEAKARHMLHTTHELKAPFASIHANTQLLLKGYCGPMPEAAQDVLKRIAGRCRRLAVEIQEMLQLANLRSTDERELQWAELDLAELLEWCIQQTRQAAEERGVVIETDIRPARTVGVEDQLKILLVNVLSNAVVYSKRNGRVRVCSRPRPETGPEVRIEDNGIGIYPEKLPHIFEEYYRTDEAVRHNKGSSGIGLAIVKHVADAHHIRVRVDSQVGKGTTFTLCFS